jgi:hydroxymethylbilane synthase
MAVLKLGTRASQLALKQAEWVAQQLAAQNIQCEIVPIHTQGDEDTQTPLHQLGSAGVFIKEIEATLLEKRIDVAVHSAKDLPAQLAENFTLSAFCGLRAANDVLVLNSKFGKTLPMMLEDLPLPHAAEIATGSLRRMSQLSLLRPDLSIKGLRGNVQTRLKKLEDFDAIVLAKAGLERLDILSEHLVYEIPTDVVIPAVGQGVLALETRADDVETQKSVQALNDKSVEQRMRAEREFLKLLQGGCQVPIACYGWHEGETLHLLGYVGTRDGSQSLRKTIHGSASKPEQLGKKLAEQFLMAGVAKILESEKNL